MKSSQLITNLFFSLLLILGVQQLPAQTISLSEAEKGYLYESVEDDPLKARVYTLDNGLRVYLSVNRTEPRISTLIPVRAGSTSDPASATGLAHYLEHMLFKGTSRYGTQDFEKEKPLLEKIESLYEAYHMTQDTSERKRIYAHIDSISNQAAEYAIPNEYDKVLSAMGARGTNAFTDHEVTCYMNDIPANQLESWLKLEAERFREPVMRLFHTELEAVYEEKNRSLDSDYWLAEEAFLETLFPTHNYGQQTTIGTIEHLKNPSLKKIREYYNNYYVPNNMAFVLAGDLDYDQTIALIDKYFGSVPMAAAIERKEFTEEAPLEGPLVKEIFGPEEEFVRIGFRMPGAKSPELHKLTMVDMILNNSEAGLIDLNLNQKQIILNGGSYPSTMIDYSFHSFRGSPREGQSLEEVKDHLLSQIELVKEGKFEASLMEAIINDFEVSEIQGAAYNMSRSFKMMESFQKGLPWRGSDYFIKEMRKLTKQDIVDFANTYYKDNNYVVIYKRNGDRQAGQKVEKPPITPVSLNRDVTSPFVQKLLDAKTEALSPRFLNYKEDIFQTQLASGIPVNYLKNDENQLFTLYYLLEMGKNQDKILPIAVEYLEYLGTQNLSPEEVRFKRYSLGTNMGVSASNDQVYVYVSGLKENLRESVALLESLLNTAEPDQEALEKMVEGILKKRADAKLDRYTILQQGLYNYGSYGATNPFNDILSEEELRNLKAEELVAKLKELEGYDHKVLYYGPHESEELIQILDATHQVPSSLKAVSQENPYTYQETQKPKVLFVDYDMVQAELVWLSKSVDYNPALQPQIQLFNQYFGGNMGSLVFQTIRESKALAYSAYAQFRVPPKKESPYYTFAYIGTQADKIHEAIAGMQELLDDMPADPPAFTTAQEAIKSSIEAQRIVRTSILFNYLSAQRKGLDYDLREKVYEAVGEMAIEDLKEFHETYIKDQTYTLLVLGSKDKIDLDSLKQYGEVQELSLEEIFGY